MELDGRDPKILFGNEERPNVAMDSSFGSYMIYTSGTTGKPKGVDVRHRGLVNNLLTEPAKMKISVGKNVGQLLNISFDMGA